MNTKNTTPMDDCLNVDCITVPRFMEAMDFLGQQTDEDYETKKLCICGRVVSIENERGCCNECNRNIDDQISRREYEEQFGVVEN